MIPPSSQSLENEEATLKIESSGGFPTPPVGPFSEAANLDSSVPGAKGYAYLPECVEGVFSAVRMPRSAVGTSSLK
jgi:hypothetical protein